MKLVQMTALVSSICACDHQCSRVKQALATCPLAKKKKSPQKSKSKLMQLATFGNFRCRHIVCIPPPLLPHQHHPHNEKRRLDKVVHRKEDQYQQVLYPIGLPTQPMSSEHGLLKVWILSDPRHWNWEFVS